MDSDATAAAQILTNMASNTATTAPAPPQAATTRVRMFTGRHNYREWAQFFKVLAEAKGIWKLYTGEETIKAKPQKDYYKAEAAKATTVLMRVYWRERFESDVWEWKEQQNRVVQAVEFFRQSMNAIILKGMQPYDLPAVAWHAIEHYFGGEPQLHEILYGNMRDIQLGDCRNMACFLDEVMLRRAAILNAGLEFTDSRCKLKIITSVDHEYAEQVIQHISTQALNAMSVDRLCRFLLWCEQQLPLVRYNF